MKIALPSVGNKVDGHFGHCEYFTIFTIKDKKIVAEEKLDPPEGCGCKSNVVPQMAELGVKVLLAGNMGQGAVNKLSNHGIQVVRGCSGDVHDVAKAFLEGAVVDSGEGCDSHAHGHDCGNH